MNLDFYLVQADEAKARRLKSQWCAACTTDTIECGCGIKRALRMAYRCLYCGEWFCHNCAEKHFGQTLKEWIAEKRIQKRRALSQPIMPEL
jgi:hypothetical protein